MIYILNEFLMNGTVTLKTTNLGVNAKTFEEAVLKVKGWYPEMQNMKKEESYFSYIIPSIPNSDILPVYGLIKDEPLQFIQENK